MSISTRDLEENEAKIDNLLNKVLHSARLIEEFNKQIGSIKELKIANKDFVIDRTKKIDILIQTITNLVILADEIDVTDESTTKELDKELRENLDRAIEDIKDSYKFLEKKEPDNIK